MKKNLLLILFIVSYSFAQQSQLPTTYLNVYEIETYETKQGKNYEYYQTEQFEKQQKKIGITTINIFYKSNKLYKTIKKKTEITNEGNLIEYEILAEDCFYENGNKHYSYQNNNKKEWYLSGNLKTEINYNNGKAINYTQYYEDGSIKIEGIVGKENSVSIKEYFPDKKIKYSYLNKNDITKNSISTLYYNNGKVKSIKTTGENKLTTIEVFYPSGNKKTYSSPYDLSKRRKNNSTEWHDNGEIKEEIIINDSISKKIFTKNKPKINEVTIFDKNFEKTEKISNVWDEKGNSLLINGDGFVSYEYDEFLISGKVQKFLKVDEWTIENKKLNEKEIIQYQNGKAINRNRIKLNKPDDLLPVFSYEGSVSFSQPHIVWKYIPENLLKYQIPSDKEEENYKTTHIILCLDIENTFEEFPKIGRNISLNSLEVLASTNNSYELNCLDTINNLIEIEESIQNVKKIEKPIIANKTFIVPIKI